MKIEKKILTTLANADGTIFDGRYWRASPRGTLAHRRGGEKMKTGKTLIKVSALAAMAILVAVAFVGLPTTAGGCTCEKKLCDKIDLVAGQDIDVGIVHIWFTEGTIHIAYEITEDGWWITATHLSLVVKTPDENGYCDCKADFPVTKKGSPIPGHFAFYTADNHDKTITYAIDFDSDLLIGGDFAFGKCLCIAAHAVVVKEEGGYVVDTQTGWGEGPRFTDKDWAMYYCFIPIKKDPVLPEGKIQYYMKNPGTNCYWDTWIVSDTEGTNVPDDRLDGWCIETTQTIGGGSASSPINGYLSVYTGKGYHQINYLYNMIDHSTYSWEAFQVAIWYFCEDLLPEDADTGTHPINGIVVTNDIRADAWEIINEAKEHGDWLPTCEHNLVAVHITPCPDSNQDTIFFVDP